MTQEPLQSQSTKILNWFLQSIAEGSSQPQFL